MKHFLVVFFLFGHAQYGLLAQNPKIIKLADLLRIIETRSDKIQVINFWATWCAPCVKEMPLFEKANNEMPEAKVTLVSLDLDLDPAPDKVYRFVERKKLTSTVLILDETDANSWINKIDGNWSGALPATLVVNTQTGKRKFMEGELKDGQLEKLVNQLK